MELIQFFRYLLWFTRSSHVCFPLHTKTSLERLIVCVLYKLWINIIIFQKKGLSPHELHWTFLFCSYSICCFSNGAASVSLLYLWLVSIQTLKNEKNTVKSNHSIILFITFFWSVASEKPQSVCPFAFFARKTYHMFRQFSCLELLGCAGCALSFFVVTSLSIYIYIVRGENIFFCSKQNDSHFYNSFIDFYIVESYTHATSRKKRWREQKYTFFLCTCLKIKTTQYILQCIYTSPRNGNSNWEII